MSCLFRFCACHLSFQGNHEMAVTMTNDDVLGDEIPNDQLDALRQFCYQALKLNVIFLCLCSSFVVCCCSFICDILDLVWHPCCFTPPVTCMHKCIVLIMSSQNSYKLLFFHFFLCSKPFFKFKFFGLCSFFLIEFLYSILNLIHSYEWNIRAFIGIPIQILSNRCAD